MRSLVGLATAAAVLLGVAACGSEKSASDAAVPPTETAARAPTRARTPARPALRLVQVASGLDSPVDATAPRSEPGRIYVVEQAGRIVVVQGGRVRAEPFLDIRGLVRSGGEQGLLSVAFDPRYAQNRRFYVDYTDVNGDTRVVEYRSDGVRAVPGSARQLLFVDQPYPNHNGGDLVFGPDGRLYVGMGDGGSGGDPQNRAQNPRSLLGKLLALNVRAARPTPQMVALGLRNPWRFSFDRANGDLYIGDVGQSDWEEIDYTRRRSPGLENYGWDAWEGRARYEPKPLGGGRLVRPIVVYGHGPGHCSVTGGFVYRGRLVPAARGRYFYGDYCTGVIWSTKVVGGRARGVRREPFRVRLLSSFGEDARGELLAVSQAGWVYRLAR
jgi:glucose/arabinose dehydrogenase